MLPATVEHINAALDGRAALEVALDVEIPESWPPEHIDQAALEFTLQLLTQHPDAHAWSLHFIVWNREPRAVVVGVAGFSGAPGGNGTVELGYSVLPDFQRRGFAVAAVKLLLERAFAAPSVTRVIARTLPHLAPSIGVLTKLGFTLVPEAPEPGVIEFELMRR